MSQLQADVPLEAVAANWNQTLEYAIALVDRAVGQSIRTHNTAGQGRTFQIEIWNLDVRQARCTLDALRMLDPDNEVIERETKRLNNCLMIFLAGDRPQSELNELRRKVGFTSD